MLFCIFSGKYTGSSIGTGASRTLSRTQISEEERKVHLSVRAVLSIHRADGVLGPFTVARHTPASYTHFGSEPEDLRSFCLSFVSSTRIFKYINKQVDSQVAD